MRRAAVVGAAVVAALIVGLGAGLLWIARDGSESAAPPPELVRITTSLGTSVHAFGDPVDATVDVLVDTREVDLSSVRPQPNFDPYEQLGPPRIERVAHGPLGRVRYRYRLVCLKEGCDAAAAVGVSDFPSARVRYRFKGQPGSAFEAFDWPSLQVASRVANDDVEQIRWRSDDTVLPAVSYRVAPRSAALVLLLIAVAAAAAAALLARRLWWPQAEVAEGAATDGAGRSPLERAFDVAFRAADEGDSPECRRALERVARELGGQGRPELAHEARALAWAPSGSTHEQVSGLADLVGVSSGESAVG